jgi:hypothetical protein
MKSLNKQKEEAALIVMGIAIVCVLVATSGCARVGMQGPQGNTGQTGNTGAPGSNCTVTTVQPEIAAPNGGSLITCPGGSESLVLNGSTGQSGTNGTNGTVVTPVQFCANTTTYPTTFSEVGFCIRGNLYAVYSLNDGFLSEIVPGEYESDGVNSSCDFTVSANCVISH